MVVRLLHYSDIEGLYDDPVRVARFAGLIHTLRDESTLVFGSGDNTAPGVLSLVTEGSQAVSLFERIEPDAETFGNHDFDYGTNAALDVVRASPQQWVSANIEHEGDPFGTDASVVPSTVFTVGDVQVGVIGVIDPATPEMSPRAGDLDIADPIETVATEIAHLRRQGVDHLVALSHLGSLDDELARRYDLDAILGGHIHTPRIDHIAGTICTRPGANGHHVLEIDLEAGDVAVHETRDGPVLTDVRAQFERRWKQTGLNDIVARVDDPIERQRALRMGGECRAGNFIADAYRWAGDADLALHNSGGIRDGPALTGDVRIADLVSLVPFDERVVIAELTGHELWTLFEESYRVPHGEGYWYAHVSGARVVYNKTEQTVTELSIGECPVDHQRIYRLATTSYLLSTRHEFPTLTDEHRIDTLDTQYEVLAAYAREHGIAPHLDGRIAFV